MLFALRFFVALRSRVLGCRRFPCLLSVSCPHPFSRLSSSRFCLALVFAFSLLGSLLASSVAAQAPAGLTIYDDALQNGWQNWGWATLNYANTAPVHSGTASVQVQFSPWQGMILHHADFNTSAYGSVTFWVNGGPTGGQQIAIKAIVGGSFGPGYALPALAANTWQQITVPLSSFGADNLPNLQGFCLQENTGATLPAFYVDDIALTPAVPLPQLTLTPAGVSAGYKLTTFASHFPYSTPYWAGPGVGPLGIEFSPSGVLITDDNGDMHVFPDADGQDASQTAVAQNYGQGNAVGLTHLGGKFYMAGNGQQNVLQINADGTLNQVVATGIVEPIGIVGNPATGNLFISTADNHCIYDVNPVAKTATLWLSGLLKPDGVVLSSDNKVLYVGMEDSNGDIVGYDTTTKAVVWDYNQKNPGTPIANPDGITLGSGSLAGQLVVNTNQGKVYQISIATGAATLIASGGSRGDFVAVDPNGTELLTQTDSVLRLTPPPGSGFGTCIPASLQSLTLNPTGVAAGTASTGTITLSGPAAAGGQAVLLQSSSSMVTLPATVLVPYNQTSANFPIATNPAAATASVLIKATYHDTTNSIANSGNVQTASLAVTGNGTGGGTGGSGTAGGTLHACGPMDVVFVIDSTGSMSGTLQNVQAGIPGIISQIQAASGGDYRLGLIEFWNDVEVFDPLASGNSVKVQADINAMYANGGGNTPQSSDVAALTAINALSANYWVPGGLLQGSNPPITNPTQAIASPKSALQTGDFSGGWRSGAEKIVILITDAPPSEFNNSSYQSSASVAYAHYVAQQAQAAGVFICPINVSPTESNISAIMMDYAATSGGVYSFCPSGQGTSSAIANLINQCGNAQVAVPTSIIYTRDDLPHTTVKTGKALVHSYSSFGISGVNVVSSSAESAAFNFAGIIGKVTAAQMQRAGTISSTGSAHFDLQWGITSLTGSGLASFGPVQAYADTLPPGYSYYPALPFSYSATSWALPLAFNADIEQIWDSEAVGAQTGGIYKAALTDLLSSVCGVPNFADTPHTNWPQQKNILTIQDFPLGGLPQIDQGRCLDLALSAFVTPSYSYTGYWEILLGGKVIASAGSPAGWNVEPDQTSFGGVTVTVPPSAAVSGQYQVNSVGASALAGSFGVITAGSSTRTAILRPLVLDQSVVVAPGTATGTVSLDAPAPRGGATVTLSASAGVSVPSIVLIPEGQTSITFTASSQSVSAATSAVITASYNGYRSALLGVLPVGSTISGLPGGTGGGGTGGGGGGGSGGGGGPGTPLAPVSLTATGGNGKVALQWTASAGATDYAILRSQTKGGNYALFFAGLPQTALTDFAVTNGVTYYYVVAAHNLYGFSKLSNEASATPLGTQVPTPTITANGTSTNGVYPAPLSVTIADSLPGAIIRYTVDGTAPTATSSLYSGPLSLSAGTTTVTAVASKSGSVTSTAASATFVVTSPISVAPYALACGSSLLSQALGTAPSQFFGAGFYADYYTFAGSAGDIKTLTMSSGAFDTYLVLRDPSGNIVATNDDAPAGTTSSKWTSQIVYTLLTTGTYTVEATSYTPGNNGSSYAMALSCTTAAPPHLVVTLGSASGTAIPNGAAYYNSPPVGPALTFGPTPAGVPVSKSFLLQNTGGTDLTLSGVSVPSGFSVTSPLTSPIKAGASEPFVLRFEAGGSTSSAATFVTNDPLYAAGTTTPSYGFTVYGSTSGGGGTRPKVPQNGSTTFPLNYAVTGLPAGGWYIQNPSGQIVGTSDPNYGSQNGWSVSLAADNTTVTVGAPPAAPILAGYNVYVSQGTPFNAATFDVVPSSAPTVVPSLTAQAGNALVNLSWSAVLNATSYNLYRSTTPGGEGTTPYKPGLTGTAYTDTGLTNGTPYYYWLTAVNSLGEGGHSLEVSATPQALTAPVLKAVAGSSVVNLNWTSSTGATGYAVYRGSPYPGSENLTTPLATINSGTTLTYADTTGSNGTTYYYKVKALGSAGAVSNLSNEASATPQAQAGPTLTSATPSGSGQVALVWNALTGASYYYVYYSSTPSGPYSYYTSVPTPTPSTPTLTATVSNLTNGTTYYFVVQANLSNGSSSTYSAYSNELSATPNVLLNLAAQAGNASVSLTWSAASATATYNLYRGTIAGGEGATPIKTGLTGTACTDPGLTNNIPYFYQLTAVNSAGNEGGKSNEAGATPQAVPATPLSLTAQAGNAQVLLSWTAVPGVSKYYVKRGTAHGGPYTLISPAGGVAVNTYTDATAVNGTTYYYVVTAVNSSGESPSSNEATATPLAPPDVPLALTASAGNAQVQLLWSTSTRAASYVIYRGTTAGGEDFANPVGRSLTPAFVDNTVSNNVTYYYVVKAVNAGGFSAISNEASATPALTVTATPTITALYTSGPLSGVGISNNGKFNLPSGTSAAITLQSATPGAKLYYTLGTPTALPADPTTASTLYSGAAIPMTASTVIKVVAAPPGTSYSQSLVTSGTFTLNTPPTVTLSSPNGLFFHTGDNVPLLATAADTGTGSITQVKFLATVVTNGVPTATQYLLGTATSSPYQISWAGVPLGTYSLTAVAFDSDGGVTTSAPLSITVGNQLTQVGIACNQLFNGSLSTSDGASTLPSLGGISFAGHYADQYQFTGTPGQTVTLSLNSSAFDAYLALKDPTGAVVASNDDAVTGNGVPTHNSQIAYPLPATLPGNGLYTIEVTSAAAGATGPYSLQMDCAGGSAAPAISASYLSGSTVVAITSGGAAVDFGAVPANTPVLRTITLKNTGTADLAINGISGSDPHFTLTSSPASPVPPGQSTSFTVSYSAADIVARTASVTITSNASPASFVVNLSANSQTPAALTVKSFVFAPGTVPGGTATTGTVTLSGNAPAGGQSVSIALVSGISSLVSLPPSVIVQANQASVSFTVTPPETATGGTVTASASVAGSSQPASLIITASQLVSIAFSPNAVAGGTAGNGTVTLRSASPSPTIVALSAPNSAGVTVPSSVTVPANATTQTFTATTAAVTTSTPVVVTATLAGISKTATLTVNPAGAAPTVSITNTTNGGSATTTFTAPASVTINTSVTPGTAAVQKVVFYESPDGGATFVKIGETTSAPYSFQWLNVPANPAGSGYSLKAVVIDAAGLQGTSALYLITVSSAPLVPMPVLSPLGGSYTGLVAVSMTDSQPGTVIFYTLGTPTAPPADPTTASSVYRQPLLLTSTTTVKAKAFASGYAPSVTNTQGYTITPGAAATISARITAPVNGTEATGLVAVTGTITSGAIKWEMDYQAVGDAGWTPFYTGSQGGAITGTLDTTLLLNGQYQVLLRAVDANGNLAQDQITLVIKGDQKVGYFTLSYTDMTIPIGGMPISVMRTYDSRNKSKGDFGVGWTLSTTQVKFQKPEISGYDWIQVGYGIGTLGQKYQIQAVQPHLLTFTMPNGDVYNFAETVSPNQQQYSPLDSTDIHYQQVSGRPAALAPVDQDPVGLYIAPGASTNDPNTNSAAVEFYENADLTTVYDPQRFQLTLANGTKVVVDKQGGLISITNLSGITVYFTPSDIQNASKSQDVKINRVNGLITSITDLNGVPFSYAQDGFGNLFSAADRNGNTTTYEYDPQHNLTAIHAPNGALPIANYYYPDGRLNYSLDANGNKVSYSYPSNLEPGGTAPSNSQVTTDQLGNKMQMTYDSYGNVVSWVRYLNGRPITTSYTFDAGSLTNPDKPTSMTDALGRTTSFGYDTSGNLSRVSQSHTDASGNTTTLAVTSTYNAFGEVLTTQNPNQQGTSTYEITNVYDGAGHLTTTTDALGNATLCTYNPTGGTLSTLTDALGNKYQYFYDGQNNVSSTIGPNGSTTTYTYDNNGKLKTESLVCTLQATATRPQSTQTILLQFGYDPDGHQTSVIGPDGASAYTHYNSLNQLDQSMDSAKRVTMYIYDGMGHQVQVNYPSGRFSKTTYDAAGKMQTASSVVGRISGFAYDSLYRLVASGAVNPSTPLVGGQPNWILDGTGKPIYTSTNYNDDNTTASRADIYGNTSKTTYDDLARVVSSTDPLNATTRYTYDALGKVLSATDANNHTTNFTYDADSRGTGSVYPDNTTNVITYDARGRKTAVKDQDGRTTQYTYDAFGHILTVTTPMSETTRFAYDEIGNKISQTDANNHTTYFAYDIAGRLVQKTLPLGQYETVTYNPDSTLATMTDYNGHTTTYGYDAAGRGNSVAHDDGTGTTTVFNADSTIQQMTRTAAGGGTVTTTYGYEPVHAWLTSVQTAYGTVTNIVGYGYDSGGRLAFVQSPSGKTQYAYDANSRLYTVTSPDTKVTKYAYDKVGNRYQLLLPNGVTTTYGYDALNRLTSLANSAGPSYTYNLDFNGQRLSMKDSSVGTTLYAYDGDGRLTKETFPNNATSVYAYDPAGNRKSLNGVAWAYDANDRLLNAGSTTYTYDNNGNVRTSGGATCTYDAENHLLSSGTSASNTSSFLYDAGGNRVQAVVGTATTNYVVDTQQSYPSVLEERDGTNALVAHYDYGADRLRMDRAGAYYYVYDGLGSVRALTNASGTVTDTYAYDAFGNTQHGLGSSPNPYQFNGQALDSTGLYFLRARYYNPGDGRFLSQDPLMGSDSDPASLHRYLYASGDPVNRMDPGGREDFSLTGVLAATSIANSLGGILDAAEFAIKDQFAAAAGVDISQEKVIATTIVDSAGLSNEWTGPIQQCVQNLELALVIFQLGSHIKDLTKAVVQVHASPPFGKFESALANSDNELDTLAGEDGEPSVSSEEELETEEEGLGTGGDCPVSLCLVAGSRIEMADGTTKAIETLQPCDQVVSRNTETGKTEPEFVTKTISRKTAVLVTLTFAELKSGHLVDKMVCTPEHPLFVRDRGWVPAGMITVGDFVLTGTGDDLAVNAITWHRDERKGFTVYNLTVDDDHTYFVGEVHGGIWVHNCANADKLAANMKTKYGIEPPGNNRKRWRPHHIVPSNDPRGKEAQDIMKSFGIDLNEAENGIYLPDPNLTPGNGFVTRHSRTYTDAYFKELNADLASVKSGTKQDILDKLGEIQSKLSSGSYVP